MSIECERHPRNDTIEICYECFQDMRNLWGDGRREDHPFRRIHGQLEELGIAYCREKGLLADDTDLLDMLSWLRAKIKKKKKENASASE